jgi:hypothetical protein
MKNPFSRKHLLFLILLVKLSSCTEMNEEAATSFTALPTTAVAQATVLPSETPKPTEIPTVQPTFTPIPSKTPYAYPPWGSKSDAYTYISIIEKDNKFRILGTDGISLAEYDLYKLGLENTLWSITIDPNYCGYLGYTTDRIIQFDPEREYLHTIFTLHDADVDGFRISPRLSPTGNYVSNVIFSGFLGYNWAEFQDVEVLSRKNPQAPIKLTKQGGSWKRGGQWAPERDQLAYTDYDEHGYLQVFITTFPEIMTKQLTHFNDPKLRPGPLQWAPDGRRLVVVFQNEKYVEEEEQNDKVEAWVISIEDERSYLLPVVDSVSFFTPLIYWSADAQTLMFMTASEYDGKASTEFLWYSVDQQTLIAHLSEDQIADWLDYGRFIVVHYFPLLTNLSEIVFTGNNGLTYYRYSARTNSFDATPWTQFDNPIWLHDFYMHKQPVLPCE